MRDMAVVLLCVASLALAAGAQTMPAAGGTAVTGTVTGTDVYVRSGPSQTAYPCTKIHKPATVTITARSGEWLEIEPVPGTFSVIAKQFVTKQADGSGIVNADAVHTRAGGDMVRPGQFWGLHPKLNKGDKVAILGEVDEYYKITPPRAARYYVSGRFVSTDGAGPIVRTGVAGPTTRSNGGLSGNTVEVTRRISTTQQVVRLGAKYDEERKAFDAVEKALVEEWAKPAEERDITGLIEKYKSLALTEQVLEPFRDHRVKWLESVLDRRNANKSISDIVDEAAQINKEIEDGLTKATTRVVKEEWKDLRYDAQGVLGVSNLFTGGATGPKRYVLRDSITQRVDAYIQCTTGAVKLDDYMGKEIGVFGKPQYDKSMMLNVVEVTKVVMLNREAKVTDPVGPTIKETLPPPTPKLPPSVPSPSDVPPENKPAPAPGATPAPAGDSSAAPKTGDNVVMDLTDSIPAIPAAVPATNPTTSTLPTTRPN